MNDPAGAGTDGSSVALDPAGAGTDAVELVLHGRSRPLGDLAVTRVLPTLQRRMVGPFLFFDHMGPRRFPPGAGFDVPPHPHIGLSTVTYLLEGEVLHRDSLGTEQIILPGDVNLMTAGRGVVHSERATERARREGGAVHGLQLWLALPEANEEDAPSFVHVDRGAFPRRDIAGAAVTVLFGEAFGAASPLLHPSRPLLLDVELPAGAAFSLPALPGPDDRAVYVVSGAVSTGTRVLGPLDLAVAAPGRALALRAEAGSRLAILGGPSPGRRYIDWNFVSSDKARIERAKDDWRARRFPLIPGDDVEFVPLPEPRS